MKILGRKLPFAKLVASGSLLLIISVFGLNPSQVAADTTGATGTPTTGTTTTTTPTSTTDPTTLATTPTVTAPTTTTPTTTDPAVTAPAVSGSSNTGNSNGTTTNNSANQTAGTGNATSDPTTSPPTASATPITTTIPTPAATDTPPPSNVCPAPSTTDPSQTNPANSPLTGQSSPSSGNNTVNNGVTVNNCAALTSQSGNATVSNSHSAGNATTGNSTDVLNLINQLASATGLSGNQLATFIQNVNGDVNNNITIDPAQLAQLVAAAGAIGNNPNTTVNSNAAINNTDMLSATSGNATVADNGHAGNATTGNASAIANIVNLIDSIIAAQQSFIGMINIYGNLNGNILLPQQLVDSLLNGTGTPVGSADPGNTSLQSNQSIINNVALNATSGDATVSNNHNGGNATTGNATTKLNIYNLAGDNIIASNALLVIVNVMGQWVGFILNAPAGTNMALLGGGVSQNGMLPMPTGDVTSNTTQSITNNLVLNATSGNALVDHNRVGGNATSGNATAEANIVNFLGDQFSLSGWFGILIINVFGNWNGSLALYSPPLPPAIGDTNGTSTDSGVPATVFKALGHRHTYSAGLNNSAVNGSQSGNTGNHGNRNQLPVFSNDSAQQTTRVNWLLAILGIGGGAFLISSERVMAIRKSRFEY